MQDSMVSTTIYIACAPCWLQHWQTSHLRSPVGGTFSVPSPSQAVSVGGKTATLKTLGLLALMPKAGLFVPADGSKSCGLEWFSEVLADVGDSQDLAQNLSTFSGHVHRLKRITAATSASSLVLLDEVTKPILHTSHTPQNPTSQLPKHHTLRIHLLASSPPAPILMGLALRPIGPLRFILWPYSPFMHFLSHASRAGAKVFLDQLPMPHILSV